MSHQFSEGSLYVGVTRNPDQSLNFSKALRMDTVQKRARELLPRVLQDEKTPFSNPDTDNVYRFLSTVPEAELRSFVTQLLARFGDEKEVKEALQECSFSTDNLLCDLVAQRLHVKAQPVPVFTGSLAAIRVLRGGADGFAITLNLTEHDPKREALYGFIVFSSPHSPHLMHEYVHALDPMKGERVGEDRLLEEALAFYFCDRVYPPTIISTSRGTDAFGNETPEKVTRRVSESTIPYLMSGLELQYRKQYKDEFASDERFKEYIQQVGKVLLELEEKLSKQQVLRALTFSRSLKELQALVEMLPEN